MKILSWNINGLRAAAKKGFFDWLISESADMVCIQETKIQEAQVPQEFIDPDEYHSYWCFAERKGYSGVATFSKIKPEIAEYGFDINRFDNEGRILITKFSEFTLLNIYFPNGKRDKERLDYKMDFYDATLQFCNELRKNG